MRIDIKASTEEKAVDEVRADTLIKSLKSKTPKEIEQWVSGNITTLEETQAFIIKLAILSIYILRKLDD